MRSTSILQKQSTTTDDWCDFQIETDQRADKQSTKTDERHVKRYKQSTQRTMGHHDINCTVISTTTTQQSTNNGHKIKMSTTDRDRNQEANDNEPAAPVPRTPARRPAQLKDSDDSLDNAGVPVVTPARPTARATEQSRPTRAAPHPRDPTNSPPRQRPRVASQFSRNASRHTRLPLSGQASSGGWKLVWDIPPDANDPNLTALIEAARTADLWPDDFIAAVEQTIEVRQQQPLFANTTETVPVLAGLTDQSKTRLNPKTVAIYGEGLQSMNIDNITSIYDILKLENNAQFTVKQTKFNLTFIVMPSVGKVPSVKNSAGISFTSPALWHHAIQYRYAVIIL